MRLFQNWHSFLATTDSGAIKIDMTFVIRFRVTLNELHIKQKGPD